jgi:hypothetical protein
MDVVMFNRLDTLELVWSVAKLGQHCDWGTIRDKAFPLHCEATLGAKVCENEWYRLLERALGGVMRCEFEKYGGDRCLPMGLGLERRGVSPGKKKRKREEKK